MPVSPESRPRGWKGGVQGQCVNAESGSLAIALHVKTDELPKDSPQWAPWRPTGGIAPRLNGANPVTPAMAQVTPGFTPEARLPRHVRGGEAEWSGS